MKPSYLIFLIIYIVVSIPLIFTGFGEPDAWRSANTIRNLAYTFEYTPSRFPGFPVVEFINAILFKITNLFFCGKLHFWIISNLATFFISILGIYSFAKILEHYDVKNRLITILSFTFLPALWIASTSTVDYIWALSFVLAGYYAILQKKYINAGILLGLASGCRITSYLILPALVVIIYTKCDCFAIARNDKKIKFRNMIKFVVASIFTTIICYLPLIIKYGFGFLWVVNARPDIGIWGYKFINDIFGLPAFVMLAVSLIIYRKNFLKLQLNDAALVIIVFLYAIFFIVKPDKTDYIIPAIPFFLILLVRFFPRRIFISFAGLLLLNNFISFWTVDMARYRNEDKISFNIVDKGVILRNIELRQEMLRTVNNIIKTKMEDNAIVLTGWYRPIIEYVAIENNVAPELLSRYYNLVSEDELKKLKESHPVYYIPVAYRETKRAYKYKLDETGAKLLSVGG
ncbi:MAG: hypothetical protein AABY84_01115 [Candidatus Firestonebacteria bacterium]